MSPLMPLTLLSTVYCLLSTAFVPRQRHQREVKPIQMILQVEDPGEAGAGELIFGPGAIRVLRLEQEPDTPGHRFAVPLTGRQKPHDRPGRLGRGARALAPQRRVIVG